MSLNQYEVKVTEEKLFVPHLRNNFKLCFTVFKNLVHCLWVVTQVSGFFKFLRKFFKTFQAVKIYQGSF